MKKGMKQHHSVFKPFSKRVAPLFALNGGQLTLLKMYMNTPDMRPSIKIEFSNDGKQIINVIKIK